jgi:hypothetical protein
MERGHRKRLLLSSIPFNKIRMHEYLRFNGVCSAARATQPRVLEEEQEHTEAGFQFVVERDGIKIYRKRE